MAAASENKSKGESNVLQESLGGGPHGIGDPNDRTLRKVERDIMIPQKMKEKAKKLRCAKEVKGFGECAKEQGLLMPFQCRKQAEQLKSCLESTYTDPAFVDLCTQEYLDERSKYRRTGIRTKDRPKKYAS